MNRWLIDQKVAAALGAVGGALGVIAGVIQTFFGATIPRWTGNKAEPTALGLLTIGLSLISVLSALMLFRHPPISARQRLAAALGLLVPGSLCFSTGGALWYVPGAILVTAGVYAVIAGEAGRTREVLATAWLPLLISVLGAFEVLMAVSAGPVMTATVGVIGGLALMVAPWSTGVAAPVVLLLIGTVPFAVIAWWTVAAPLLAVVAIGIGVAMRRSDSRGKHVPAHPVLAPGDVAVSAVSVSLRRS